MIDSNATTLGEVVAQTIYYIEARIPEITADLQNQLSQEDTQLFGQLVETHLNQLRESSLVLVNLIDKYDAGTLEQGVLLAYAQWT